MNELFGGMITMALTMQRGMDSNMKDWKDRLLVEWVESMKMPRKMKKKARKSILLDWSIVSYDPFEGMYKF